MLYRFNLINYFIVFDRICCFNPNKIAIYAKHATNKFQQRIQNFESKTIYAFKIFDSDRGRNLNLENFEKIKF